VTKACHLFQQIGVDIDHPVTPATFGGLAGVDLVRIHGDDGFFRREVLGTAIAKAFRTGLDGADAKGFVGVRLKGVFRNMRVIKFRPGSSARWRKRALSLSSINCSGTPCTVNLLMGHLSIIKDDPRGCHKK
jgi:hypothetical protein